MCMCVLLNCEEHSNFSSGRFFFPLVLILHCLGGIGIVVPFDLVDEKLNEAVNIGIR